MSTTIDEKVVEMRFDNKQFEKEVSTTMSTLDKFKQALSLGGTARAAQSEFDSYKKGFFSLKDSVNKMWSLWEYEVAGKLKNFMQRTIGDLTIGAVKSGFSEYETQMNAVQTILANTESKGKTLDDVNSALDELNKYADKTIYNFTEMTRNIGTFTAAGVDLDTSVSAIKGIANLAAVSGSTSQQASTAMYQLSQAMASGTVKLMDWNSVVNAGMGGQVFQDALKETARVHGVAIDDIISKQGSFRESLSEGWLTTEILTDTLAKFTGDLSEEQLKSMGYTDEQIKGIIKMGETANNAATKVKTFTQLMDTLKEAAQSGWTQTWEILVGDFEEAKALLTEVSDTIGAMIGRSAEARNELLENWKVMGGRADLIEAIRNAFHGVMSVIKPVKEAFRDVFPPLTAEKLVAFTKGLRDLTEKLKLSDKASENLRRTFRGIFSAVKIAATVIVEVFKGVVSLLGGLDELGGGILSLTARFGDWIAKLNDSMPKMSIIGKAAGKMRDVFVNAFETIGKALESCSLFKIIESLWKMIVAVGSIIAKVFGKLAGGAIEKLSAISFENVLDFFNALVTGGVGIGLIKLFKSISKPIEALTEGFEGFSGFLSNVKGILDGVKDCLSAYQDQLKATTLQKIATAIAILAASIFVLSLIDPEKIGSSLGAITVLFTELMASMAILSKISGLKGAVKACASMISISIAVLILASALKKIADLETNQLITGLAGIAGLMAIVVATIKAVDGTKMMKGAVQLIFFAAAIKILASACKDLSGLSWKELAKGLVGVGVLMAGVAIFLNTAKFSLKAVATATGIVILAAAIKVLASACKDFGQMDANSLTKGLASIALILAGLAVFTNAAGNAKHVLSTGIAMIAIAAAMKIFASAMRDIGSLSVGEIAKGLLGMAGALAAITIALNFLPSNMVGKGVGLIAVSTAILILSNALNSMGGMSWEAVGKGLLALGGSLAILAIGLHAMSGTLAGSAALLIATAALAVLTPCLLMLGGMSWEGLAKGMIALAGSFVILGVAGAVLSSLTGVIVALSAALLLAGAGILLAGMGFSALAVGISALIGAIAVGAAAIMNAIVNVCKGIVGAVPAITEAIFGILTAILTALTEAVPVLMTCVGTILDEVLQLLLKYVPKIVNVALKLITALLQGIADNIGGIVDAAIDVIVNFVDGISRGLPRVIESGINLMISFINGLADGIRNNTDRMIAAVNNLMDAVMGAIKAWFTNGKNRGKELIGKVADGIKDGISGIKQAGKDAVAGFIQGIKDKLSGAADAAKSLGKKALDAIKNVLGINSPAKEFIKVGRYSDEGMIKGLKMFSGKVSSAAGDVGSNALKAMRNSISDISDAINRDVASQPTIRPVLDLSDVRSGANSIRSIFSSGASVGVMANVGAISSTMSARNQNGANDDVVSAINKLRKDIGNTGNTTYQINGVTYDDGSNISDAVKSIVRAARIERRV